MAAARPCWRNPRLELPLHVLDVLQRGQARLIAAVLHLERRDLRGEAEMLFPSLRGITQVGEHVGAVEHVAGAASVDHAIGWHQQRAVPARVTGLTSVTSSTSAATSGTSM